MMTTAWILEGDQVGQDSNGTLAQLLRWPIKSQVVTFTTTSTQLGAALGNTTKLVAVRVDGDAWAKHGSNPTATNAAGDKAVPLFSGEWMIMEVNSGQQIAFINRS